MNVDPKTAPAITPQEAESPALSANPISASSLGTPGKSKTHGSWQIWLWRLRALLLVTVCATFGVLLLILPWTPKWTDNPLLLNSPQLRDIVSSGFVRGLSSGLGVLDLWLGFWEAIHYHESPS